MAMNNQRIIYANGDSAAIVVPTPDSLTRRTIDEIAKRIVPLGVPYKIVDVSMIPTDRTFRGAWEVIIDEPDGYGENNEQVMP